MIHSTIASYYSQKIKETVGSFSNGKYFDTVYYNPVKPRLVPWRVWFWILKRYFTHKVMWMEKIKGDKGQTVTFARYSPLRRTNAWDYEI